MYVLFHGAGLGSWIWEEVLPHLDRPALALDLPHLGVEACVEHVLRTIEASAADSVVIVGHSVSGGLAMAVAGRLGDRVEGVVMVGAIVPESGQAYVDGLPWISRTMLRLLYFFVPEGSKPPDGVLAKALCNDLDADKTRAVVARSGIAAPGLFLDPVRWATPKAHPVYVKLTEDQSDVTPALQDRVAARLHARVVELNSGHLPMMSQPVSLAAALNSAG
jgi:pimeloyl-ACP methyl ester carboxylesterase